MITKYVPGIKFDRTWRAEDISPSSHWWTSILWLWEEDDVSRRDPSAEHLADAIIRLRGSMYDCAAIFSSCDSEGVKRADDIWTRCDRLMGKELAQYDGGDCFYKLYAYGWVTCNSYDGDSLGRVVVQEEP